MKSTWKIGLKLMINLKELGIMFTGMEYSPPPPARGKSLIIFLTVVYYSSRRYLELTFYRGGMQSSKFLFSI